MENKLIKETLNSLLENEKALKIIEEQLNSIGQGEDGEMWATPSQVSKIAGIIGLAYFDEDRLNEVLEDKYFEENYTGGNIVIGIDTEDATIFTEPIEGNFYLEVIVD